MAQWLSATGWASSSRTSSVTVDLDIYVANDTNPNRLYENVAARGADAYGSALGFARRERAAACSEWPTRTRGWGSQAPTMTATGARTSS